MSPSPRQKVLLVDDREENLVALEALLRQDALEILRARSGREALELLLVHEVALAVVDVQMPERDGVELAELMRGAERTRAVPIIFVTAGPHDRQRLFQGYEAGAVDFLYKPLDPLVLRSKVGVFLQLHWQRQALSEQLRELRRVEEELRAADRHKNEFLAILSHELRNPLAPVRSSLFVLGRAAPGSEQERRARAVIERQVAHMARLIDDLLDVTRITRGKVQLQREAVELGELVGRVAEDHRAGLAARGLELEVRLPGAPAMAWADRTRIAQAVGNLLANAGKFTPRGGRVTLSLERAGGRAVLKVRDTGVGINPEMLSRIFLPFAQADRTLDRSHGGLGLGLALVKGMVELHGGAVAAKSEGPGRGAEFSLELPLLQGDGAPPGAREEYAPRPAPGWRRRVLVVEDNLDAAESLREAIELMGHEVAVAHDGAAGLAAARAFSPAVVLCDIGLPGMRGYEVARALRADPRLSPTPVLVAVTGYALPEDQQRAAEAGFAHHLAKPPSLESLEKMLGREDLAAPQRSA